MNKIKCIFWNVERMFSIGGASPVARALGATAQGGWNRKTYAAKLDRISSVLAKMTGGERPGLLALCEVSDINVVDDICKAAGWPEMKSVSTHSEEGLALDGFDIDLLYDPEIFVFKKAVSHNINNRFATRDILDVGLRTVDSKEDLVVMVHHWPSRQTPNSEGMRIGLGDYTSKIIDRYCQFLSEELLSEQGEVVMPPMSVLKKRWETPIVMMGDFNDDPWNTSIQFTLKAEQEKSRLSRSVGSNYGNTIKDMARYLKKKVRLYNPSWNLVSPDKAPYGTMNYKGSWHVYDQIMLSLGLLKGGGVRYVDGSLQVFADPVPSLSTGKEISMATRSGRPKEFDKSCNKGVSDHFPIMFELTIK